MTVPRWVRAVQLADRAAWSLYRATEITRDEVLRALVPAGDRDAVTADVYARQAAYLPGGARYEAGLFDWEKDVLSKAPFPPRGRLLLAAAGGGRELRVLAEMGFVVDAFEPNQVLIAGSQGIAARFPNVRVLQGSFEDLIQGSRTGGGPLAPFFRERYDAAILGWGSLVHVLDPGAQRDVLAAMRAAAPTAPLLASFFLREKLPGSARSERLRKVLRRALGVVAPSHPPLGLRYEMASGFVYWFTEDEIHGLAVRAGYEVLTLSTAGFPHAVLSPL